MIFTVQMRRTAFPLLLGLQVEINYLLLETLQRRNHDTRLQSYTLLLEPRLSPSFQASVLAVGWRASYAMAENALARKSG